MFWNTKKKKNSSNAMPEELMAELVARGKKWKEDWLAKNVFYTNENFTVMRDRFFDHGTDDYIDGYGVFNSKTDIREAEARRLVTAIALADMFHDATVNYKKPQADQPQIPPQPSILTAVQSATIQ